MADRLGYAAANSSSARSKSTAVCLWEADSVENLRDYVEGLAADAAENTYFEVDGEMSMGLPEGAQASA